MHSFSIEEITSVAFPEMSHKLTAISVIALPTPFSSQIARRAKLFLSQRSDMIFLSTSPSTPAALISPFTIPTDEISRI